MSWTVIVVAELLFTLLLFAFWWFDYEKFKAEQNYMDGMFSIITQMSTEPKDVQVLDVSQLASYDHVSISKFNKLKSIMRAKVKANPEVVADFSDIEEEDFDSDEQVAHYRLSKCVDLLNESETNMVENYIQNSTLPIPPHRHWMRSLDEASHKILSMALRKRAIKNCTAVQTNHKTFRLVNNSDMFTFEGREYRVGELLKNYIRWESDQVIHYANCLKKNYGGKIWHEAVLNH